MKAKSNLICLMFIFKKAVSLNLTSLTKLSLFYRKKKTPEDAGMGWE